MRASPWLVGCLLLCSTVSAIAEDGTLVARATATQSKLKHLPSVVYDPSQSVAQFNKLQQSRDPSGFLAVSIEVPRQQITLRKLTDRPVQFTAGDQTFPGRVTAAFLRKSDSDVVTIHALIENRKGDEGWMLTPDTSGVLSINQL